MQIASATSDRRELSSLDSDRERYQRLYHSYAPLAYGIILRFIDSEIEAADVLTKVFLDLCREGIPGPRSVSRQHIVRAALSLTYAHLKQSIPDVAVQQKAAALFARSQSGTGASHPFVELLKQ
jgi:hypothetical protein